MTQFNGNSLTVQGIERQTMPLKGMDGMETVAMQPSRDSIRLFQTHMAHLSVTSNVTAETSGARDCHQQTPQHIPPQASADGSRHHLQLGSATMSAPRLSQPIVSNQHPSQTPTAHDTRTSKNAMPLHRSDRQQAELPSLTLQDLSQSLVQALNEEFSLPLDTSKPPVKNHASGNENLRQAMADLEYVKAEFQTQVMPDSRADAPGNARHNLPHGNTEAQTNPKVFPQGTEQPMPHVQATFSPTCTLTKSEDATQNTVSSSPLFQETTADVTRFPSVASQTATQPTAPQGSVPPGGSGEAMGIPGEWSQLTPFPETYQAAHIQDQPMPSTDAHIPRQHVSPRVPDHTTIQHGLQSSFQTQSGQTELIATSEQLPVTDTPQRLPVIPPSSQNAVPLHAEDQVARHASQQSVPATTPQIPQFHTGNGFPESTLQSHHHGLPTETSPESARNPVSLPQSLRRLTITPENKVNLNTPSETVPPENRMPSQTETAPLLKDQLPQPTEHYADTPAADSPRRTQATDARQMTQQQPVHRDTTASQPSPAHVLSPETTLPTSLIAQSAPMQDSQQLTMNETHQEMSTLPRNAQVPAQAPNAVLRPGQLADNAVLPDSQSVPVHQETVRPEGSSQTMGTNHQNEPPANTSQLNIPQRLQKHGDTARAQARATEAQIRPQADTQLPSAILGADIPIPMVPVAQTMTTAQIPVANLAIPTEELLAQTVNEVTDTLMTRMDAKTGVGEIKLILKPDVLGGTEIRIVGDAKLINITFFTYDAAITSLISSNQVYLSQAVSAKTQATVKLSVIDVPNRRRTSTLA